MLLVSLGRLLVLRLIKWAAQNLGDIKSIIEMLCGLQLSRERVRPPVPFCHCPSRVAHERSDIFRRHLVLAETCDQGVTPNVGGSSRLPKAKLA